MKLSISTAFSVVEININDEDKNLILQQIRKCMREHSELQIDAGSGPETCQRRIFLLGPDVVASSVFELK